MKTLKNILKSNDLVCSFLSSNIPNPNYSSILESVKAIQEFENLPSIVFVPKTGVNLVKWYSKMFEGFSFEETEYDNLFEIYTNQLKTHNRVILVAESQKKPLFEGTEFYGVDYEQNQIPSNFKEFSHLFSPYLTENNIRKLYQESFKLKKYTELSERFSKERNDFYNGVTFKVGTIVEENGVPFEIVSRGANYIQVVNEQGETSRKFITSVVKSDKNMVYEGYFKGYTPSKKFFDRQDIVESFDNTIQAYENGEIEDTFAIIKTLKAVDNGLQSNSIDYQKVAESLDNINQLDNHLYIKEVIDDSKLEAANIIANSFNVKYNSSNPDDIVNQTIIMVKKSNNKTKLQVLKKMLNTAEKVGIKYNNKLLESNSNLRDIHKDYKNLKQKPTEDVLSDHQDFRKIGVTYKAKDVGGKKAMIQDILSHKHGPNQVKTYKELSYHIKNSLGEATRYGSERAGEFAWSSGHTPQPTNATSKNVYKLVDKKTNRTVSTHGSTLDALTARKKLRGTDQTHSIVRESLNEVHQDPDYQEEIDILGYPELKKKLAKITGIENYGEQEPGKSIQLKDLQGNPVGGLSKSGDSLSNSNDQNRKMKVKYLTHPE